MVTSLSFLNKGRSITRGLVAGFAPWRPGFYTRSGYVRFMVDKVALEQVFSSYCGFPCQYSSPEILHSHLSSGADTLGQLVADVPSGLKSYPTSKTPWL
jgi:hypothetical protein